MHSLGHERQSIGASLSPEMNVANLRLLKHKLGWRVHIDMCWNIPAEIERVSRATIVSQRIEHPIALVGTH